MLTLHWQDSILLVCSLKVYAENRGEVIQGVLCRAAWNIHWEPFNMARSNEHDGITNLCSSSLRRQEPHPTSTDWIPGQAIWHHRYLHYEGTSGVQQYEWYIPVVYNSLAPFKMFLHVTYSAAGLHCPKIMVLTSPLCVRVELVHEGGGQNPIDFQVAILDNNLWGYRNHCTVSGHFLQSF